MTDGPATTDRYEVFVSFADGDAEWVHGYLLTAFRRAGVRYLTHLDFPPGRVVLDEFERVVHRCNHVLLVLSPAYVSDRSAGFLDLLAQSFGVESGTWPVIPLVLRPVERLPVRLAILTKLSATDRSEWENVVDDLCTVLGRPPPPPDTAPPECPYPGMVPFGGEDSGRFFGREEEIDELVARVRLHSFLTVIGPSGSGKSSLVHAGLIPALERRHGGRHERWQVRVLRPGGSPLQALTDTFDGADPITLALARSGSGTPDERLLVVVDQLEELFTVARVDVDPFQRMLERLSEVPGCTVLTTVRADFYPQLMTSPLWRCVRTGRVELLPIDGEALKRAIAKPAAEVGVYVEAALVERLVADAAGEPGALPLVQETLALLWGRLERRLLPMAAYEALVVGLRGYRTGLEVALTRRAEGALDGMTDAEITLVRRILLRLVQFGEGRPDTRRQQSLDSLRSVGDDDATFLRVLDRLVAQRIVTLSGQELGQTQQVDLSHEALIASWPGLQAWIAERRDAERRRRALLDKAAEWRRLGRGRGGLLDEVELAEATRWLTSEDAVELGKDVEVEGLAAASAAQLQAERQAKEDERRRIEEERAAEQRRKLRGLYKLAAVLSTALALVVTAGVFALVARHAANHQRDVAHAGELALQAQALADTDLDAAIMLSQSAYHAAPTVRARGSLLAALQSQPDIVRYLQGETGAVGWLATSPDGRLVAAGGDDRTVLVWDAATGRQVGPALHLPAMVRGLAFDPAGRRLAVGGRDGTVRIWDLGGQRAAGIDLHAGEALRTVVWSHDGRVLAAGGLGGTVVRWDTDTWRPAAPIAGFGGWVQALAFSPDDRTLAVAAGRSTNTGRQDGQLALVDVAAGRIVDRPIGPGSATVRGVAFDRQGTLLASAGEDGAVRLFEGRTGRPAGSAPGHHGIAYGVAFTAAGTLVSVGRDHTIQWWDPVRKREAAPAMEGGPDPVDAVAALPDGSVVVSTAGHEVIRWSPHPASRLEHPIALPRPADPIGSAAWSPDGRLVATGSAGGLITVRDAVTGRPVRAPLVAGAAVVSLAFAPDGRILCSATEAGTVRQWDTASWLARTPAVYTGQGAVDAVAVDPTGATVATAGDDGTVRQWTTSGLTQVGRALRGGHGRIVALAYSSDGRRLATASADGAIVVWQVGDEPPTADTVTTGAGELTSLAFDGNGDFLIAGTNDGLVQLWRTDEPAADAATQVTVPGGQVAALALAADGRTLASAGQGGSVALWDVHDGHLASIGRPLAEGRGPVAALAFRPDGRSLLTAGTWASLWDVGDRSWRRIGCAIAERHPSRDELHAWVLSFGPGAICPDVPLTTDVRQVSP